MNASGSSTAGRTLLGLVAIALLVLASRGAAQQVRVDSVVQPADCILGEEVLYALVVKVMASSESDLIDPPQPEPPSGRGYDIRFIDTRSSQSSRINIIGSRQSASIERETTFIFGVTPKALGRTLIPEFSYACGGRDHRVTARVVTVTKDAPGNPYVSLSVTADRERPYVNQAVTLRCVVRTTKLILTKPWPELRIPWASTPNGFHALPLPEPTSGGLLATRGSKHVQLNDQPFDMTAEREGEEGEVLILERTLYPIAPGRVELGGTSVKVEVATRLVRSNGFFREVRVAESAKAVMRSDPIILEVRDAPTAGRPASYTGVIGEFVAEARLSSARIRAGDGITLTLAVTGPGDIEGLRPPELTGFDDFDVYPPDRVVAGAVGMKTMTFSWLLVPRSTAVNQVPRFEFSWFRPSSESFSTVGVGPEALVITGEARDEGIYESSSVTPRRADEIRTLAEGVRPLMVRPGTVRRGRSEISTAAILVVLFAPLASFAGIGIAVQRRRRLRGDESLVRRRRASKEATVRLAEARELLGSARGFHGKLGRSLTGFIGDKLGVPAASVSTATARELLGRATVGADLVDEVVATLEELDTKEFGRVEASDAARLADLTRVEGVIDRLDRAIKR